MDRFEMMTEVWTSVCSYSAPTTRSTRPKRRTFCRFGARLGESDRRAAIDHQRLPGNE